MANAEKTKSKNGVDRQEKVKSAIKPIVEEELKRFLDRLLTDRTKVTQPQRQFRNLVLERHFTIEHLLDSLILVAIPNRHSTAEVRSLFMTTLSHVPFAEKVTILEDDLGLIDHKIAGKIKEINKFRIAQAHPGKGDNRKEPTPGNRDKFLELTEKVENDLICTLAEKDSKFIIRVWRKMLRDATLREEIDKVSS